MSVNSTELLHTLSYAVIYHQHFLFCYIDCEQAAQMLLSIQGRLAAGGDNSLEAELAAVQAMLASPLFQQCVNIQESLDAIHHEVIIIIVVLFWYFKYLHTNLILFLWVS